MADILIVDDDQNMCSAFRSFLEQDGHNPIIASDAEEALNVVQTEHPDLVIMDIRMPGTDGLQALQRIKEVDPDIHVVIMTAFGTSQTSIEAMRLGAFDYLTKPLDLDDLRSVVNKALADQSAGRNRNENDESNDVSDKVHLIGNSPRMQEAYKIIGLLAKNDVHALITGERGTGKQIVAQTIHFNSRRKDKPFLMLNCQSQAPETLESLFFGSEGHPGKLERAVEGTLYIESIQFLPVSTQGRLAAFLKSRIFESPDAPAAKLDTRVLAAATEDLAGLVRQGQFSAELYDALKVVSIDLPPLRERKEDIPDLVRHFIRHNNAELHRSIKGVGDGVLPFLQNHAWPGNVTELENTIMRACILSRGDTITVEDLGSNLDDDLLPARKEVEDALDTAIRHALQRRLQEKERDGSSVFHDIVGQAEAALVREALLIAGGNQVKAAEMLGLNRTTLRKKMNWESR